MEILSKLKHFFWKGTAWGMGKKPDDETLDDLRELSRPDYSDIEIIPAKPIQVIMMSDTLKIK